MIDINFLKKVYNRNKLLVNNIKKNIIIKLTFILNIQIKKITILKINFLYIHINFNFKIMTNY